MKKNKSKSKAKAKKISQKELKALTGGGKTLCTGASGGWEVAAGLVGVNTLNSACY